MTKTQLIKHRDKIAQEIDDIKHRLEGLHILERYYIHCLAGLERGNVYDIELGIKVKGKVAQQKYQGKVASIRHKLEGCKKEEELLIHRLEGVKKDIDLCAYSPTVSRGRPKKIR